MAEIVFLARIKSNELQLQKMRYTLSVIIITIIDTIFQHQHQQQR